MTKKKPVPGQLITGAGGVLLILSLFLPWTGTDETRRTGFELLRIGDVFFLVAGLVAVAAALTWKRYGLFRPDLSLSGAADLLGLVATILLAWLIIFDFPSGASREVGVFLAMAGAIAIAAGVGDYSTLRGAPLFPRIDARPDEARPGPPTDR
jgi:drug/metabolite transporter (DMT)-like permease